VRRAASASSPPDTSAPAGAPTSVRVLVLFESTPRGRAALRAALELLDGSGRLTVLSLAPQSSPSRCCGPSAEPVNCAVRDASECDLREARDLLGSAAERATFKPLVGLRDPPFAEWVSQQDFDLVVLPAHRLALGGHPCARRLRRATEAEIRIVG